MGISFIRNGVETAMRGHRKIREGLKKNGLFSDIDQKGGWVSCRNDYFLKP